MHFVGLVFFALGVAAISWAQVMSSLLREALPERAFAARRQWPFRTLVFRVLLVVVVLSSFNAGWRLSHQWWVGVLAVPLVLLVGPRLLAPRALLALRQDRVEVFAFMRDRWQWALGAYVAMQAVDIIGALDYRPFG